MIRNLRKNEKLKNLSIPIRKSFVNEAFMIFNGVDPKQVSRFLLNEMMQILTDCKMSAQALEMYETQSLVNDHLSHVLAMKACISCKNMNMAHTIIEQKIIRDWSEVQYLPIQTLTALIDFYGLHCSDIKSALKIFNEIPRQKRDAINIGVMMKAFIINGKSEQASQLYEEYEQINDNVCHMLAIKACISNRNIEYGKNIIQSKIYSNDENINNLSIELLTTLIDFYGVHCLDINTAEEIFDKITVQKRNVITINAMVKALLFNDKNERALQLYGENELITDNISHMLAIKACINNGNIDCAKNIIELKINLEYDCINNYSIQLLTTLIDFYGVHCSDINTAEKIFNAISIRKRNEITGSMMKVLTFNGKNEQALQLYEEYDQSNDNIPHVFAIKACINTGNIECAKNIIQSNIFLNDEKINDLSIELLTTLIDFYGVHCLDINAAEDIFDKIPIQKQNVITNNAMMKVFTFNEKSEQALQLYEEYEQFNNSTSHVLAIKACISDGNIEYAKLIIQSKIDLNDENISKHSIELLNTLIDFYGVHCLDINTAQNIFNAIPVQNRNTITMNTMVKVLTFNGKTGQALQLFEEYEHINDDISHMLAIKACISSGNIEYAKNIIQTKIYVKYEFVNNPSNELLSTLIDFYGIHCSDMNTAERIFNDIPIRKRNVSSINSMMNVYRINELNTECMKLFEDMFCCIYDKNYAIANGISFVIGLQACMQGTALHFGQKLHQLMADEILHDLQVQITLISMYGKCGQLQMCTEIFADIKANEFEKYCNKIELFHAMMNAYARNGALSQTIKVWNDMTNDTPLISISKTYCILFTACSHIGDAVQARVIFDSIDRDCIRFDNFVRTSFVDVLSRTGWLDEALHSVLEYEQHLLKSETQVYCYPMWMALLGGCRKHKNDRMSLIVYNHIQERFVEAEAVMGSASVLIANTFGSKAECKRSRI